MRLRTFHHGLCGHGFAIMVLGPGAASKLSACQTEAPGWEDSSYHACSRNPKGQCTQYSRARAPKSLFWIVGQNVQSGGWTLWTSRNSLFQLPRFLHRRLEHCFHNSCSQPNTPLLLMSPQEKTRERTLRFGKKQMAQQHSSTPLETASPVSVLKRKKKLELV